MLLSKLYCFLVAYKITFKSVNIFLKILLNMLDCFNHVSHLHILKFHHIKLPTIPRHTFSHLSTFIHAISSRHNGLFFDPPYGGFL